MGDPIRDVQQPSPPGNNATCAARIAFPGGNTPCAGHEVLSLAKQRSGRDARFVPWRNDASVAARGSFPGGNTARTVRGRDLADLTSDIVRGPWNIRAAELKEVSRRFSTRSQLSRGADLVRIG